ncbi:outer membrane protein insertion porin family [Ereboglobus sp. PH5-5]|uniref:outer membrane protein assembly factor BamA n=1 Tax=Ereboglobus sp. PH5-5 TaxID=2940529 RepID=UPI0024049893|nr:outer membrane protein assembly factor BamA [Ereboglobus sp. PH5-5]MDF9832445.1 outer membrane protein insertion porin family [Ereboglobus sp. PH5-5]
MKTIVTNPSLKRITRLLVLVALLITPWAGAHAQHISAPGLAPSAPQPYRVGTVTVRFVGTANINEQLVRANMQVRPGIELDETMIDNDIRSLYRTGLFEFIEVKREVLPTRVINIIVEVTPKYRIQEIRFEGNKNVKSHTLEKETKSRQNMSLDERQVKADSDKIREYYQKKGYNRVYVSYDIERDRATGYGTVIFKIREGNRVKIKDIQFTGNNSIKSKTLRGQLKDTKRWWMWSWLTGSGRFKDEEFEDDLDKLRDYYREQGFLDIEIPASKVTYAYPEENKLIVTIAVEEGRQYRIGDITFSGNKLYPTPLFQLLIQQRPGMVFTPSKLDQDVETIQDFYGKDGYLETYVRMVRKPNIATGNIDVEYQINESEQYFVESIKIEGNTKTKGIVIIRELNLGPGEVFDMIRMKRSKMRLDNTRFFEDANLSPETTNIPGRRNLKIAVQEGRTGNLQFGAGFSSLEKAVVFAELSQSNFDLFNRKSFWQGAGQKFRIRLQLGSSSSEATINFEEPWFLQKELHLGFTLYRTSQNYDNSYYDDVRLGGQVSLRKRLFELFEGMISYTYEEAEYKDIDSGYEQYFTRINKDGTDYVRNSDGSVKIFDNDRISRIGFQLLRDTRNKIINTTDGGRIELTYHIAGGALGGTMDYYALEFRGSQFFPIFRAQEQSLGVFLRAGVVEGFGDTPQVQYAQRFFLGGPYSLRGFENRDVGPKDSNGSSMGGNTYGMLSVEYSFDIVSPVRFAFFYDAGFVNEKSYDFNPSSYNDNFGFGLRLFVAGAPLSLDFGIPLTTDKWNHNGNQFNFSFGTRF